MGRIFKWLRKSVGANESENRPEDGLATSSRSTADVVESSRDIVPAIKSGAARDNEEAITKPESGDSPPDFVGKDTPIASIPGINSSGEMQKSRPHSAISQLAPTPSVMEQERLWDEAYDGLKKEDPKLVARYEEILSLDAKKVAPASAMRRQPEVQHHEEVISQDETKARWCQARQLIDKWLEDTENENSYVLKDFVRKSVQTMPASTLAWACVCHASQVLFNPRPNDDASCARVIYIVHKMDWYSRLTRLCCLGVGDDTLEHLKDEQNLRGRVINLYKAIFSCGMEVICGNAGNLSPNPPDDTSRAEAWAASIQLLTEAENNLSVFNGNSIKQRLIEIMDATRSKAEQRASLGQSHPPKRPGRSDEEANTLNVVDLMSLVPETESRGSSELYQWVRDQPQYKKVFDWNREGSQVLLISGDLGRGKTSLLREIKRQLGIGGVPWPLTSYFCSRSRGGIENSTTVLRGLIQTLLEKRPELENHRDKALKSTGRSEFDSTTDFFALSAIFFDMLKDERFTKTYLVIDGIDECYSDSDGTDMKDLLVLIKRAIHESKNLRWIVSITHLTESLKQELERKEEFYHLNLESSGTLKTSYCKTIALGVSDLARKKGYGKELEESIAITVLEKSRGNLSWANIASHALLKEENWYALELVKGMLERLDELYSHARGWIAELPRRDHEYGRQVLETLALAFRPLNVSELAVLAKLPSEVDTAAIVNKCFPFLKVQDDMACFANKEAKLIEQRHLSKSSSLSELHSRFTRTILEYLSMALKATTENRNGQRPSTNYATIHWMTHLARVDDIAKDGEMRDSVISFMEGSFLQWLQVISSNGLASDATGPMHKLKTVLNTKLDTESELLSRIRDAERVLHFYTSADGKPLPFTHTHLLFCSSESVIKMNWIKGTSGWFVTLPTVSQSWDHGFRTIAAHKDWIRAIAFSPDGRLLASGSDDKTIRIWDAKTGLAQQTLNGHEGYIYSLTWSCEGLLASASSDGTIRIWDCATGDLRVTLPKQSMTVKSVKFSPDGKKLAVCTDEILRVRDVSGPQVCNIQELPGHGDWLLSVDYSSDGKRIASGGDDRNIKIWDADTGGLLHTFQGHRMAVNSVAFSPNGQQVASGSNDETVQIWSIETGKNLKTLGKGIGDIYSVAFSPDGSYLASGSKDHTVRIWNIATGELRNVLNGHKSYVRSTAFKPEGNTLASASDDGTIRFWDITDSMTEGGDASKINIQSGGVDFVTMSPDGKHIASVSSATIYLWDGETGKPAEHHKLSGQERSVTSIFFSPDGKYLVSASKDRCVRLWDVASGAMSSLFEGHTDWVRFAVFSPDGETVASASDDKTVRIWSCKKGDEGQRGKIVGDHQDYVRTVAFSPDGNLLASGGDDTRVLVWDTKSLQKKCEINEHTDVVTRLVFSEDSTRIISSSDGEVWVCDAHTGGRVQGPIQTEASHRTAHFDARWPQYMLTEFGFTPDRFQPSIEPSFPTNRNPSLFFDPNSLTQGQYGISADNCWITWNTKNVIHIPYKYQPTASWVQGDQLVIGTKFGEVLLFRFSKDFKPPTVGRTVGGCDIRQMTKPLMT